MGVPEKLREALAGRYVIERELGRGDPAGSQRFRREIHLAARLLYRLRGDRRRAAVHADSARLSFEEQIRAAPDDGQRHAFLGLALAHLGRKADAVREGRRAVELMPMSRDRYLGPYIQLQLVRIYLLTGRPEEALDQLEPLLRVPFYLSPAWLRIDPTFDPLRSNPRFRKLAEGTA